MGIEHKEHDDAVDKVLAALKNAAPPDGMEGRIAQRLAQQANAAHDVPFCWRNMFAGSAFPGPWWRGAATGAAAAMLITGAVLFAGHLMPVRADRVQTMAKQDALVRDVAPTVVAFNTSSHTAPAAESHGKPCASPSVLRVRSLAPPPSDKKLLAESQAENVAPSRPAPELALTAQERGLARLVRTADPKELVSLNSETQAKLQAKDEADFDKFFAPPAPAVAKENNE